MRASHHNILQLHFPLILSSSGSVTLHQWQQLAKPNLGGILHPRPGVLTKDFRELEVDIQHVYSLNDLEEDEPDLSHLSGAHGMGRTHTNTLHTCLTVPLALSVLFMSLNTRFNPCFPTVTTFCSHFNISHSLFSVQLVWSFIGSWSFSFDVVFVMCGLTCPLTFHDLTVSPSGPNLPQTSPTHTITTCKVLQPSPLTPPFSTR